MSATEEAMTAEQVAAANVEHDDDDTGASEPQGATDGAVEHASASGAVTDTARSGAASDEPEPDTDDDDDSESHNPGDQDDEPGRTRNAPAGLAVTDDVMEKGFKQAEREAIAHAERLQRYFGPAFADLEPCPLCPPILAGWRFPVPAETMAPEQVAAVRAAIGLPEYSNLKPSKYAGQCECCGGLGQVLTGSSVRGSEAIACPECKGRGWKPIGDELTKLGSAAEPAAPAADPIVAAQDAPDNDPWGRPSSHPGYMVMPYRGMPEHQRPSNYTA